MNLGSESDPLSDSPTYTTLHSLGKGSFGEVVLATSTVSGEKVAVKCLKRGKVSKYVEAEIVNHSRLRHPFVVEFNEVFLTPDSICISMEFASGGNLFSWLQRAGGKLSEGEARWFFQQIIIGVDYCHQRGVVNRDIKLENILLQVIEGAPLPLVKICDFGYSKADFQSAPKSRVGTPTYMAPEVLYGKGRKYDGTVSDVWSCGIMLYTLLLGKYPFQLPPGDSSQKALLSMIAKMVTQKNLIPADTTLTPEGLALLKQLLTPDPSARITIADIQTHPWFLRALPRGAETMTPTALNKPFPPGHQTAAEISRIIGSASPGDDTSPASGCETQEVPDKAQTSTQQSM